MKTDPLDNLPIGGVGLTQEQLSAQLTNLAAHCTYEPDGYGPRVSRALYGAIMEAYLELATTRTPDLLKVWTLLTVKRYIGDPIGLDGCPLAEDKEHNARLLGGRDVYGVLDSLCFGAEHLVAVNGWPQQMWWDGTSPTIKAIAESHAAVLARCEAREAAWAAEQAA